MIVIGDITLGLHLCCRLPALPTSATALSPSSACTNETANDGLRSASGIPFRTVGAMQDRQVRPAARVIVRLNSSIHSTRHDVQPRQCTGPPAIILRAHQVLAQQPAPPHLAGSGAPTSSVPGPRPPSIRPGGKTAEDLAGSTWIGMVDSMHSSLPSYRFLIHSGYTRGVSTQSASRTCKSLNCSSRSGKPLAPRDTPPSHLLPRPQWQQ